MRREIGHRQPDNISIEWFGRCGHVWCMAVSHLDLQSRDRVVDAQSSCGLGRSPQCDGVPDLGRRRSRGCNRRQEYDSGGIDEQ
jgi:hypothetical protein